MKLINKCAVFSVLLTSLGFCSYASANEGGSACEIGYKQDGNKCVPPTVGDIVTFGQYEQDGDTENGNEPISWRVLEVKDGKVLVISEKTLDVLPFNKTPTSITWEKSTIRSWLNGYDASYNAAGMVYSSNFIDTAFTPAEKAKIAASEVPADKNPNSRTDAGGQTTDQVFLLSIAELNKYFPNAADRKADATRYTVKKGARVERSSSHNITFDGKCTDPHCYSFWGLRTPGTNNFCAAYVQSSGAINFQGVLVHDNKVAVRPALRISL